MKNPRSRSIVNRQRIEAQRERKRPYTMSERALAQRREAQPKALAAGALAGKATGPVTEAGKAAVSRNAWKHGRYSAANAQRFGLGAASLSSLFAKPCLTTCPFHPDNPEREEAPCSLVLDGLTHAGASCLDRTVYVTALDGMMAALSDGDMDGMHGLLANELASNLQIIDQVRNGIAQHGVMTARYAVTKEGEVIYDRDGNPVVDGYAMNPLLAALAQLTDKLGVNFGELLLTPRARKQADADGLQADALQTFMGGLLQRANAARRLPRGDA